jgi:hypothetical protein
MLTGMTLRSLLPSAALLVACSSTPVAQPAVAADSGPVDAGVSDAETPRVDGGTDAASSDGGTTAREKEICDALASRAACPGGAAVACSDSAKCIYGRVMLPAATTAYATCRAAPSCKSDDACVVEAGQAVGGAAATTYTQACATRQGECPGQISGELCGAGLFAYPDAGVGAQDCLAKPCADIRACILALPALVAIAACK